jgi:hypothetical protein
MSLSLLVFKVQNGCSDKMKGTAVCNSLHFLIVPSFTDALVVFHPKTIRDNLLIQTGAEKCQVAGKSGFCEHRPAKIFSYSYNSIMVHVEFGH